MKKLIEKKLVTQQGRNPIRYMYVENLLSLSFFVVFYLGYLFY